MDRVSVFLSETRGVGSIGIDSKGRMRRRRTHVHRSRRPTRAVHGVAGGQRADTQRERFWPTGSRASRSVGSTIWSSSKGRCLLHRRRRVLRGASGTVRSLGENIRANGIMLSRDEKIVYVTNGNAILAFDIPRMARSPIAATSQRSKPAATAMGWRSTTPGAST